MLRLPLLADGRALADWETLSQQRYKDDGPNPFVLWNLMGGAFDGHLSDLALAMVGYVHPFQEGTVMVSVNERTYHQQLATESPGREPTA